MPSHRHEALVELLRRNPGPFLDLFARVTEKVSPDLKVELHSDSFAHVKSAPHAADLVVKLVDDGAVRLGVVAEVQLDLDADKLYSWPLYAVGLRADLRCDTCVIVFTPSASVARWADKPIELGGGSVFHPIVLGPDVIPAVTELDQALEAPGLAFLSALAHLSDPPDIAAKVAYNAILAARQVIPRLGTACYDILDRALGAAAHKHLENLMQLDVNQLRSDKIRNEVISGMLLARIEDLLSILEARGIALTEAQRDAIQACKDVDLASRWVRKAVTVSSAAELFTDD